MTTVHRWTGRETRALRQALRMSIRDFSAHLGVAERTVSKWEAGQEAVRPRPEMQAALDTVLDKSAEDVRARFDAAIAPTRGQNAAVPPAADALGGLTAVYQSRCDLTAAMPADQLFDSARVVRAVGLSLNLLCQDYADRRWQELLERDVHVRCLFLDPDGTSIQSREREEGFPIGQLSALTKLNIETLLRVRDRLPVTLQERLELATYDETLRFNIILVDDLCVAQPYLGGNRGVDSPAFVMHRGQPGAGLYPVFEQVFESQWQGRRAL
ncbi:DUF5919 domain-containing protein [Verrucosispora sioxanthis]|uniref:Helix-turn-helix transcriptional regulator n=1 Tax=Verrucosispora sioxanthis TaxID=2499994 RepID=A0A6M1LD17_9ACTN|nr:DUF5919 domain-containing protein [Verrucosispora sioxanthis]NEE67007.1 helix-turn-helix transcriptional regulator [Verrucosispora sioxanthis]NGM16117.1 helix-turn-helix transcriptional regulator [Verrucosispora sioxanthis]